MSDFTYHMEMPFQRPPLNWNDRHNRWERARLVKEVRRDVAWIARSHRIPPANRITVQLHYATGRRGTFDAMNYTATTKPAIDGLVDCGIVVDDDVTHVHELPPEIYFPPEPGPRCWLTLTVHTDSPAAAESQPTSAGDPTSDQIDWETVEGAVRRGVTEYSRTHLIPANGLCGEAPQYQRRMAENWGAVVAPFVTACIREDLRRAALRLSDEDRRAIAEDKRAEITADAATYHEGD